MDGVDVMPGEHMATLLSCLNYLTSQGFVTQFKALPEGLQSVATEKLFQPEAVKIIHFYRFEGASNPSDSSILYAIETADGERGTLVDSYGVNSDEHVGNFIQKVQEIHK